MAVLNTSIRCQACADARILFHVRSQLHVGKDVLEWSILANGTNAGDEHLGPLPLQLTAYAPFGHSSETLPHSGFPNIQHWSSYPSGTGVHFAGQKDGTDPEWRRPLGLK